MKKMIKIIKVAFIFFAILFLAFLIILGVILRNFDLNKFRSQIVNYLSTSLSGDVNIGHLSYEFSSDKFLALKVKDLEITEENSSSKKPILAIDYVYFDLDFIRLILKRKIIISKIEIVSPQISLVKNKEGVLNVSKLANDINSQQNGKISSSNIYNKSKVESKKENSAGVSNKADKNNGTSDIYANLFNLIIQDIDIKDGSFVYLDLSSDDKIEIPINNIFISIKDFSFDKDFYFDFKCSLFSDKKNISTSSKVRLSMSKKQLIMSEVSFRTNLSEISVKKIGLSLPQMAALKIKDNLQGEAYINLKNVSFFEQGLLALSLDGGIIDGMVQFEDVDLPVSNIDINVVADENNIDFKDASVYFASGRIDINGKVDDYLNKRDYNFNVNIDDVRLEEILKTQRLPYVLEGKIFGKMLLAGNIEDPTKSLDSFSGKGKLEVKDGKILNCNLLQVIIDNLSAIPDLGERISQNLPEEYKQEIKKNDTDIKEGSVTLNTQNKVINVQEATLDADGLLLSARGNIDFDQNLSLTKADIMFSKELSTSLVTSVEEFSYFLNGNQQIQIPLKPYNGKLSKFKTYPDLGDLGKKILKEKGKDELKKVIFKALNLDEEEPNNPNLSPTNQYISTPEQDTSTETLKSDQKPEAEKVLINNILDAIFK